MIARLLHRLLRRLLPPSFRKAHAADMEAVFGQAREAARRAGVRPLVALWLREGIDLWMTGRSLRRESRRYGAGFVSRGAARRDDRGGGWTMGWVDDVKHAVRSLVRRPAMTVFAVGTTALGIGATTAMFGTIDGVILDPVPYEHGDRMVGLFRQMAQASVLLTPTADDLASWAELTDVFDAVEPWSARSMVLTGRGEPEQLQAG